MALSAAVAAATAWEDLQLRLWLQGSAQPWECQCRTDSATVTLLGWLTVGPGQLRGASAGSSRSPASADAAELGLRVRASGDRHRLRIHASGSCIAF
jgi:hypothetical protein